MSKRVSIHSKSLQHMKNRVDEKSHEHVFRSYVIDERWDWPVHLNDAYTDEFANDLKIHRLRDEDLIKDFIDRRAEGALLVAGPSGIGKTSLVFSAVRNIIEKNKHYKKKELIPIIINATIFENRETDQKDGPDFLLLKKIVLQNLIIRLKESMINISKNVDKKKIPLVEHHKKIAIQETMEQFFEQKKLKNNIKNSKDDEETLQFKTALLQLFELDEDIRAGQSIAEKVDSEYKTSEKETGKNINVGWLPLIPLAFLGTFNILNLFSEFHNVLYPLLLGISGAMTVGTTINFKKIINNKSEKKGSKIFDNKDLTLTQIRLEEILLGLSQFFKIVFIVDEVDKMDESIRDSIPENKDKDSKQNKFPVIKVVKSLKTFLNNENALFIFIADERFINHLKDTDRDKDIPKTLFSQIMFVQRPTFKEIQEYIDRIIIHHPKEKSDPDWKDYTIFKNYLTYISENNFYSLYKNMFNFMVYCDKETFLGLDPRNVLGDLKISGVVIDYLKTNATLAIKSVYMDKNYDVKIKPEFCSYIERKNTDNMTYVVVGGLSESQELKSNLQTIVQAIYEDKSYRRISNSKFNDRLLEIFYRILNEFQKLPRAETFTVSMKEGRIIKIQFPKTNNDKEEDNKFIIEDETQKVSLADLIYQLKKYAYISPKSDTENEKKKGDYFDEEYHITGFLSKSYLTTEEIKKEFKTKRTELLKCAKIFCHCVDPKISENTSDDDFKDYIKKHMTEITEHINNANPAKKEEIIKSIVASIDEDIERQYSIFNLNDFTLELKFK